MLGLAGWVFLLTSAALVVCYFNQPLNDVLLAERAVFRQTITLAIGGSLFLIKASIGARRAVRLLRRAERIAIRPQQVATVFGVGRDETDDGSVKRRWWFRFKLVTKD